MRERSAVWLVSLFLLAAAGVLLAGSGYGADATLSSPDPERPDLKRPEQISAGAFERLLNSIDADRHAFRPRGTNSGAYEADNPGHEVRVVFSEDGMQVRPTRTGEAIWQWTLQLERFGYEGDLEAVAPAAPVMAGNRVEYRRGDLTEWYRNDRSGLEQGFTVATAPSRRPIEGPAGVAGRDAERPLVLQMRSMGLEARQEVAGASMLLLGNDGDETLRYHGLVAWDANGDPLRAEMSADEEGIRIAVFDSGASYPLTIDPFVERTILRASDAQTDDRFGFSVSISGDTAIVGAIQEDGGTGDPLPHAGAAYVFERNLGGADHWGQVKKLTASDAQADDQFGYSVSIAGDTAIVGAPFEDGGMGDPLSGAGAVYVFERNQGGPGNWGQVKKLTASDANADDAFGHSVSTVGPLAMVGAYLEDGGPGHPLENAGAGYLFGRDHGGVGNWGEIKKLAASDAQPGDQFGYCVSTSGDTVIIGARFENGGLGDPLSLAGAAYVFAFNQGGPGNWGEVKKLTASDAQADDWFGYAVSISGGTAIVGSALEDGGPGNPVFNTGAAYVFASDQGGPGNWGQIKKLTASDAQVNDGFGEAVSITGPTALVGAGFEDGGPMDPLPNAGAAYLFESNQGGPGNWGEVKKLTASDAQADDGFGRSVAIFGDMAIIGALGEDGGAGNPLSLAGAAYVVERTVWAYILDGFGGLHARGLGVAPVNPGPPYFGFDVARDIELASNGAHALDGFGGVHAAGGAAALPGAPYFGFDIAQDLELATGGGAYVLDGFGGVHAFAGAPVLSPATPYFGFDVARDFELGGGGYYVLDGFGGLHRGGMAMPISPPPPYFGFDIAKDLELTSLGGAYALDGFGGVHSLGGAPALSPTTPYFGFDVARDLELGPGSGGRFFVLDGFGGLHAGGTGPLVSSPPPYFGFDIARDLEIR